MSNNILPMIETLKNTSGGGIALLVSCLSHMLGGPRFESQFESQWGLTPVTAMHELREE